MTQELSLIIGTVRVQVCMSTNAELMIERHEFTDFAVRGQRVQQ